MELQNPLGIDAWLGEADAWIQDATELARKRPGVVLAALGVAGVLTGLVLRTERTPGKRGLPDPLLVYLAGASFGFIAGPHLLKLKNSNTTGGNRT
jgi:hypothetical protein